MRKFLIILMLISPLALLECKSGRHAEIQGKELPDDLK